MRDGPNEISFLAIGIDGRYPRDLCHDAVSKGEEKAQLRLPAEDSANRRCPRESCGKPASTQYELNAKNMWKPSFRTTDHRLVEASQSPENRI